MLIFDESFGWFSSYYGGIQTLVLACCFELIQFSVTGLLAIWGGLGRPHWFVRAMVVMAGLSFWLAVPAYEPMLVFFTQTAVAALLLSWARCRRATEQGVAGFEWSEPPECDILGARSTRPQPPPPRRLPQFSLQDMLLWTVVAALVFAAAAQVTTDVWHGWWKYLLCGTGYGLLTVLAAWVALGRSRWWLRAIGGCLAFPAALMAGWILLGRCNGLFGGKRPTRAAFRYAARVGVVAVSLLIVLPSAFLYYELVTPAPIPIVELPNPNGYDDLIRAGESFVNVTMIPERADGVDVLRAFVQKHGSALEIARTGLDQECKASLRYESEDLSVRYAGDIQNLRNLARAFRAEALLAEEEGRTEDAMRSHCDNLRLGNATARGGILAHRFLGMMFRSSGIGGLNVLSDGLSPQQCHKLIEILETSQTGWEPFEDCWTRDRVWADHALGWQGGALIRVHWLLGNDMVRRESSQYVDFRHEARNRLLIGKLAIRCYRLERGELPSSLADLVPEYLPAVLEDPFSGKSLIYRQSEDGHVLYSVGQDRIDDGGQRAESEGESFSDKDLFLYTWPDDAADPTSGKPGG